MVCDTVTGKQRISLEVTASTRGGLDYSLDGECIVLATSSKSEPLAAVYYDVVTGAQKKVITLTGLGHSNPGTCWISERHQIYGAIEDSDFVVWDLATGRERLRLPGYPDWREFTISPDGQRLALASSTGSFDSELTLWSLTSGRRLLALTLESSISAVAFSPDANRLLASVRVLKQPIQIWDATPLPEEAAK